MLNADDPATENEPEIIEDDPGLAEDQASAIESEAQAQALLMMGDDHTEYFRAFSAKRPPEFKGE